METITYSQVRELVTRLPIKKLPIAYRLLVDLSASDTDSLSLQEEFMQLPIAERRRLMAEQARQMKAHYEQTALEREAWQCESHARQYERIDEDFSSGHAATTRC